MLFSQQDCHLFVGANSARDSLVSVSDGASLTLRESGLKIGNPSTVSGSKVVVDNATLALTNELKVGELLVGVNGRCNSLELRNHAMLSMTNIGITVGQQTEAVSNLIRIASGSTFFHSRTSDSSGNLLAIGYRSPYCGLEVDGARLISSNDCINVGREATAHHTKMDILNDSYVDIYRLILGHDGSYNVVNVENSELRVRHSISAGNGKKIGQTNNVWRFSGSRTKVRQTLAGYGVYFNAGTEVEFNIPKEGLLVQPVIEAVGTVYFDNITNSECRINVDPRYVKGGRLVLIKASNIDIPDGYRFVVSPDAKLDLSVPGELAVKVKRKLGLTIVVR